MSDFVLEVLSALFAFVAAGLWLSSAVARLPSQHRNTGPVTGSDPIIKDDDLDGLTNRLRRQSHLNALAAFAAAISAALQGLALLLAPG
jgi:hypothetical protein